MSKQTASAAGRPRPIEIVQAGLKRRYAEERRFRLYGKLAIGAGLLFLTLLFTSIVANGYSAFVQSFIQLEVYFDPETLDPQGTRDLDQLRTANYGGLVKQSLRNAFPDVSDRREKRALYGLVSSGAAFQLRDMVLADSGLVGRTESVWVLADDELDMLVKGHIRRDLPASERRFSDRQLAWVDALTAQDRIRKQFNLPIGRFEGIEAAVAVTRGGAMYPYATVIDNITGDPTASTTAIE